MKRTIEKARAERAKTGKPQYIFVDFTGVTCTNCKYNENNIFILPNVKPLFAKYLLVQMYTDDVPAEFYDDPPNNDERALHGELNLKFQRKVFGTEQLPLYVILEPKEDRIDVVAVYAEGKINNVEAFIKFMKKPFNP